MTDPALQALLDKQEITELLTRYLRSVDRGDVATLRSCYLPGATEDHGGLFAGPAQEYVDSVAAGPRRAGSRDLDARPARPRPVSAAAQRQVPRRPHLRPPLTSRHARIRRGCPSHVVGTA